MVWIRTIPPDEADGRLAEAYAWQARSLGAPTTFTQLGSLEPELVHARLALYRASERTSSNLTARQKNLISHVVSSANSTPHCTSRSAIKLRELGFSAEEIQAIESQHFDGLAPGEAAVARYALKLTRHPGSIMEQDIDALRAAGLSDHDIVDANNQTAHLNYTNRVANGLGLLEEVAPDFPAFATVPE
jgi:uncharacterized peroxidase-related enzyme